ncbi:MAG: hemerythrin domain-containing protein [archaeon]
MMPVAPLMIEHRLIERMICIMNCETTRIKKENSLNIELIDSIIDFIKTYADKLHHGKEEYILFRDLSKKEMTEEHRKMMDELIHEHVVGREYVKRLVDAKEKYKKGDKSAIAQAVYSMETLAKFYPEHIAKEDKQFFIPVMQYFNNQEKQAMIIEFYEFDKKFIHKKYKEIVNEIEKGGN